MKIIVPHNWYEMPKRIKNRALRDLVETAGTTVYRRILPYDLHC